jgi:hypothetical protein
MSNYRDHSIFISGEVRWYLKALAKAKCKGTDGVMTEDQMGDCMLREKITTEYPDLLLLYSEWESEKQANRKTYEALEKRAIEAVAK